MLAFSQQKQTASDLVITGGDMLQAGAVGKPDCMFVDDMQQLR